MRPMPRTGHALRRLAWTAALALAATMAVASPAAARTPVDPGTLNPPPPDFFNAQCFKGAGGIVCTLHFTDDPIVDDLSGIVCGTTELHYSENRSVVGKRYYDADGNLVQRHFRETEDGTFTNPVTGKVARWITQDTVIHDLAVPGDLGTGTITFTGLELLAWLPGGRTVIVDAGTVVTDAGTGQVLSSRGRHPYTVDFANGSMAGLRPLCDALD